MSELAKGYLPGDVERQWYERWTNARAFRGDENSPRPARSIVIPPPNVTGVLHLGHVLNNTIQDILARRARMLGFEVLWLPGTDHAGIATQTVVERMLKKEGVIQNRDDLGRERFIGKAWEWKEKHGGIIIEQLKRLGASCDWERERFTMDAEYSRCVERVFVDLYAKGMIYRGRRMVNWDPLALTALSDEEVIMRPQSGSLYYFNVEVDGVADTFLTIATTRPETIPGDTAVAVNPNDERYRHLIGRHIVRPLPEHLPHEEKLIPIIGDDAIEIEFGTGVLKVTPAHDPADFEIGQRHGRPAVDVMNPDGTMNALAGVPLAGLDRFAARAVAVHRLRELGLLEREEPYENNIGYSERTDVPVEPRLSDQWFLRYPSVAEARACVADGRMRFFPERWARVYDHWMANIRDWCISRQLWWGHRVPVWTRQVAPTGGPWHEHLARWGITLKSPHAVHDAALRDTAVRIVRADDGSEAALDSPADGSEHTAFICTADAEVSREIEKHGFVRDPDVLDTWCSSWLWPFATMGWTGDPERDAANPTLRKFYPTHDLVTGPDIIFFWVARMIMAGFEYTGQMPFRNVYFTGIIRDHQGRKMSKSLGNSPDPLDLIDKYGADGLRFGLLRISPTGTDVRFDEKQIEEGRNFANKLWNACRYRLMQGPAVRPPQPSFDDLSAFSDYAIDILSRLDAATVALNSALESYEFNSATATLYEFFWADYCDRYLETIKGDTSPATLATQDMVLWRFLQLLHPFMPHVTEELWHTLGFAESGQFLMLTESPAVPVLPGADPAAVARAQARAQAIYLAAAKARNLKAEYHLGARRDVHFVLKPVVGGLEREARVLALLAGASAVTLDPDAVAGTGIAVAVTDLGEWMLSLQGLIDVGAERARLEKEMKKLADEITKDSARLDNPAFVEKAPPEVVTDLQDRINARKDKRKRLNQMLKNLG